MKTTTYKNKEKKKTKTDERKCRMGETVDLRLCLVVAIQIKWFEQKQTDKNSIWICRQIVTHWATRKIPSSTHLRSGTEIQRSKCKKGTTNALGTLDKRRMQKSTDDQFAGNGSTAIKQSSSGNGVVFSALPLDVCVCAAQSLSN